MLANCLTAGPPCSHALPRSGSNTGPRQAHPILTDPCGRQIDHLRLSLTEACNLACRYCIPDRAAARGHLLDAAFALQSVRWLCERHGVRHVRLTGGEPLLHPELLSLVRELARIEAIEEVALTTNGQTLAHEAARLRDAGLTRVNVSLDSINARRFTWITRGGRLAHTLHGIDAAIASGLKPVRLNVVALRGLNDDELGDIAAWGIARGCTVRFIELMPIGPLSPDVARRFISASEILDRLSQRLSLRPITAATGQPATDYAAVGHGARGVVGIIGSMTHPFCNRCRRIRLTARGQLLACLFDATGASLEPAWDGRSLDRERADRILAGLVLTRRQAGRTGQPWPMAVIGG